MTAETQTQRITYRKRSGKQFIAHRFSKFPAVVEEWRVELSPHIPDAFCTYEHLPITMPDGRVIAQKHFLWVSQVELERYKQWQTEQQRLAQNMLQHRMQGQQPLQLDDLTLEEVQRPTEKAYPVARPVLTPPIKKKEREPPPWMNMPPIVRDGNGKEYHWDTLSTTPPTPEPTHHDPPELPATTTISAPKHTGQYESKPTGHKGICRQDYDSRCMHGYRVSVTWKKVTKHKFFADKRYGDRLAALTAAIEWRNATEKAVGKPRTEHLIMGTVRSNTGYQGIYEGCQDNRYHTFQVYWLDCDGKTHKSSVSIDKYGRKLALRMAKQLRLQKAKERIRSNEGKKF